MVAAKTEDTVGAIMSKNPVTIEPDVPVRRALQLMIKKDIGSLIVAENGKAIGIITERDVTRRSLRPATAKGFYQRPVTRLMTRPLITVPSTTPVWEAFEKMVTKRIRRLPVIDRGRLVGIVTERDLLKWVIRVFYEPNIPRHIKRFLR